MIIVFSVPACRWSADAGSCTIRNISVDSSRDMSAFYTVQDNPLHSKQVLVLYYIEI